MCEKQSVESSATVSFAERKAANVPNLDKNVAKRDVKSVAIIGAGTMGGGIAMNFLNVGIPVVMLEMKQDALDRGMGVIRKNYENTASKGRLTLEQVQQRMALLKPTLAYDDLRDADLVIEAYLRNHGHQEGGVREARQGGQERRDSCVEYVLSVH